MWRSPTFWRLFGLYGALLVSAIGLLGVVIVQRVEEHYLEQVAESLRNKAILVREVILARPLAADELQAKVATLRPDVDSRITLVDESGRVLADSDDDPARMDDHSTRPEIRGAREGRFGVAQRVSQSVHLPFMYVALRVDEPGQNVAFVRVALPLTKVEEQSAWLQRVVGGAAALTVAAALILALFLARRFTRPLRELTEGAERIAAGEFGQEVFAAGSDEVAALAGSFNVMSRGLAAQFAQLAEERTQLRMILGGMIEGVVAFDADQAILFANDRAAQLLQFDPRAAPGRKLWELVRNRSLQEIVARALAESEPCVEELTWPGPNVRSLTVHAARLTGAPSRGAVVVIHDTSELRRLERLRRDFVANVSHELKTPLSVIKACVETLIEGADDDPQHRGRFLQQVAEQSDRLHALILDLLSLARIESGADAPSLSAVRLEPIVRACVERHRSRVVAQERVLEAIPPADERDQPPVAAWADAQSLNQILDNLVDNALKYTPPGGSVRVRWRAVDEYALLEVEDTGIGIPEQELPRIFERFYRVDVARSRELGGTGLGLSIVKHLVQGLGGSVSATSQVGQGSTFVVRLRRASAP